MTLIDYRHCVYKMAKSLGYSDSEIEAFKYDIDECYYNGLTVEECVDKEF